MDHMIKREGVTKNTHSFPEEKIQCGFLMKKKAIVLVSQCCQVVEIISSGVVML